jgi:hypothetical protein
MSEARDAGEAARSIRCALYDLRHRPDWTGGATRADIVKHCMTQKTPTPERYFEAAIEQLDVDKMTISGYHPSVPAVKYALTREGEREEEHERRNWRAPFLNESVPPIEERELQKLPPPSPEVLRRPQRVDERASVQRRPFAMDDLGRVLFGGEALRFLVTFGVGLLTGVLLSNLR